MMHVGKKVKNAIKGKGLSMDDAAKILGISRPTLYNSILNKAEIEEGILQSVITNLELDLQIDNEDEGADSDEKDNYQTKYIALLEKSLQEKENNISSLQKELQEVKENLNKIGFRQIAFGKVQTQVNEALLDFLAGQRNDVDKTEFVKTIYTKPTSVHHPLSNIVDSHGMDS